MFFNFMRQMAICCFTGYNDSDNNDDSDNTKRRKVSFKDPNEMLKPSKKSSNETTVEGEVVKKFFA